MVKLCQISWNFCTLDYFSICLYPKGFSF